jgi:flagellar biosynthetic protein FlhB
MPENTGQERTERATPKRKQEARSRGQVAHSREVPSVIILMVCSVFFYFGGSWMFWNLSEFITGVYQNIDSLRFNNISEASAFSVEILYKLLTVLLPILIPILIAGIFANVIQVGFQIHSEAMSPKLSKLNPISGMKRFLSVRALVELGKSLLKIMFIGSIVYVLVKSDMKIFPSLINQEVRQLLSFIAQKSLKICFFVCLAMLILAILDYIYQRWQFEKDLKMSKQEVKDEQRQIYGDPKVKARIRGVQMEMARRRMMDAVPEADVVITNPTRLAIALKFDPTEMIAPRVLAKGAGFIARRIREIAEENQVPLIEEKSLARGLYKLVEIGDYIPAELYRAVAEVLAYVYRLKGMYRTP